MLLGVFCCLKCNHKKRLSNCKQIKVLLENGWNCKQMITEGDAANPLETTLHAFRNQEKTKQISTIFSYDIFYNRMFKILSNVSMPFLDKVGL